MAKSTKRTFKAKTSKSTGKTKSVTGKVRLASKSATKKLSVKKTSSKKIPIRKIASKPKGKLEKKKLPKLVAKKTTRAKKNRSLPSISGKKIVKSVQKPIRKAILKPVLRQLAKPLPKGGKKAKPNVPVAVPATRSVPVAKAQTVAKAIAVPPSGKAGAKRRASALAMRKKTTPIKVHVHLPKGYKPGTKERYMGAKQQEYFRQKLTHWRAELIEESKQTIDNLRDEVRDVGDEAERATRETENSLELRTRDRYRKLIAKIDEALRRIDEGHYGFCIDTGDEIGLERLEARPTAERTVDAQERWEHRQRQIGD